MDEFISGNFILSMYLSLCQYHTVLIIMTLWHSWKWHMMPPTLFLFLKIALAIWDPLWFHISFCCGSVAHLCLTLCDSMDCSMPGFPLLHHLPEFDQTHVHYIGDAIQSSHPLSPSSPVALNLSQYQGLSQLACSLHQLVKLLELQLQHQSFQWISRVDFL